MTKYEWVLEKLNEGYTVDLATSARVTRLKKKHMPAVNADSKGRLMIYKIDYEGARASCFK